MSGPTKKLINEAESCVDESLYGALCLNSGLVQLKGHRVILRADYEEFKAAGKVTTITGGGSGHEPTWYGFVGEGFMTAAVHGPIFASPSSKTILAAIRACGRNHPAGVAIIFNNYTGDRLHFGKAIETARGEGIKVDSIVVGEDCAIMSKDKTTGRRGLAGSGLIMKVLCGMAEQGKSLEEIMNAGNILKEEIGTLGVCVNPCSLPGGSQLFQLGPDEMEIGLGLHGEAGVKRTKMMTAKETVITMIDIMTSPDNPTRINLPPKSSLALFINNLGSTSMLETNILIKEAIEYLGLKGYSVDRAYCGGVVTSMEMAGFSISLFILDDNRKLLLDLPAKAVAWQLPVWAKGQKDRKTQPLLDYPWLNISRNKQNQQGATISSELSSKLHASLVSLCECLCGSEDKLNQLDSTAGDGDCGTTHKAGATAIRSKLGSADSPGLPLQYPYELLLDLAEVIEDSMGGSSGALYSLFLTAAANAFLSSADAASVVSAMQLGIEAMSKYGRAQPGDRTMLDPLNAALQALKKDASGYEAAVKAAETEAEATAHMSARAGRASYVESTALTQPDPGATAVAMWMRAALTAWKQ